jgi:hypothetical protein
MVVFPLDGVTYCISELFVGTGTRRSGTRGEGRCGLGGHIVVRMGGWIGWTCDAADFYHNRPKPPSLSESSESGLSVLYELALIWAS